MKTDTLYYEDPFLCTFTATVRTCQAAENGYAVTLDRTAFYPEGGGQPADHGTLGGIPVLDVQEQHDEIVHTLSQPLAVDQTVEGVVDWDRRFDHMQQHSGEHILSGILCDCYHCDNVGFHLGADTVTIDYNTDLTWEQVMAAEAAANAVIWADRPVEITYPDPDTLAHLAYRSKKELTGPVRIVTFPEADCCACCGTHVRRAGQVGLVKVLSCQKFIGLAYFFSARTCWRTCLAAGILLVLCTLLGGRGGFAQGSVQASSEEIAAFFHNQKEEPPCATT